MAAINAATRWVDPTPPTAITTTASTRSPAPVPPSLNHPPSHSGWRRYLHSTAACLRRVSEDVGGGGAVLAVGVVARDGGRGGRATVGGAAAAPHRRPRAPGPAPLARAPRRRGRRRALRGRRHGPLLRRPHRARRPPPRRLRRRRALLPTHSQPLRRVSANLASASCMSVAGSGLAVEDRVTSFLLKANKILPASWGSNHIDLAFVWVLKH
jgi:hypothetical protein